MNLKLIPAVLTLLTLPLAAQTDAPKAAYAADVAVPGYRLQLQVTRADATMSGALWASDASMSFGVVTVSLTNAMIQFPGLPPLLASTTVVCAGPGDVLKFALPLQPLPFDLYFQGIGLIGDHIEASPVQRLGAVKTQPPLPEV